jgi:hypothetical protein
MPVSVRAQVQHLLTLCIALSVFFVTNRYLDISEDRELIDSWANDSYSYQAIAESSPHLPDSGTQIRFHHAQRFTVPYLIGYVANRCSIGTNSAFLITAMLTVIAMVLGFDAFLGSSLGLNRVQRLMMCVLLLFNPFSFRSAVAAPFAINDLIFELGLLVVVAGLFRESALMLLVGMTVAAASRQTAVLLLPTSVVWTAVFWTTGTVRKLGVALALTSIAIGFYFMTAHVAATFALPNQNIESLTGLVTWAKTSFDARTLAVFILRGVSGFLPALALLFAGLIRTGLPRVLVGKGWLLMLTTFLITLQPLLGGPTYTEGDFTRLSMLGYVPMLAALAMWLRDGILADDQNQTLLFLVTLLGVASSFHHIYSFLGRNDASGLRAFSILYLACQAFLFAGACIFRSRKVAAEPR